MQGRSLNQSYKINFVFKKGLMLTLLVNYFIYIKLLVMIDLSCNVPTRNLEKFGIERGNFSFIGLAAEISYTARL